jgi:hypothetical protein
VSPYDLALDAAVLAWILYRQRRVRRVRLVFARRLPFLMAIVGLLQFVRYNETRSLGAAVTALVVGSWVVLAPALGAIRAMTVRLSPAGRGQLAQRASWLTLVLWPVTLGAHLSLAAAVAALHGPVGATAGSAVLFLAISLGAQNTAVHHRAVRTLRTGTLRSPRAGALDAVSWEQPPADRPPSRDR